MQLLKRDKWLHIAAGFVAALAVLLLTGSPAFGALAALAVGVGKEAADSADPGRHTVDGWDALATVAPGVLLAAAVEGWRLYGAGLGAVLAL